MKCWATVLLAVSVGGAAGPVERPEVGPQTAPASTAPQVRELGGGAFRHNSPVARLALTPDGRHLVTATTDGIISVWDVATATLQRRANPKLGPIASLAVSPDSSQLALGTFQGRLALTDLPKLSRFLKAPLGSESIDSVVFSPTGEQLACAAGAQVLLLAPQDLAEVKALKAHQARVRDVAYTDGGGRLAAVDDAGTVRLWDLNHGKAQVLQRPEELAAVRLLTVAPTSVHPVFLVVGEQGAVRLYSTRTGKFLHAYQDPKLPKGTAVTAAAWLPQADRFVTVGPQQPVCLWDRRTGKIVGQFGPWRRPATQLAVGPEGHTLAVAVGHNVRLLDLANGEDRQPPPVGHDRVVHALAVVNGGGRVLSVGADNEAILWDMDAGRRLWSYRAGGPIVAAAALPGQGGLATGDSYGTVAIHDLADGTVRQTLAGHTQPIVALVPLPESGQLASVSRDGVVVLSDLASGKKLSNHRHGEVECLQVERIPDSNRCLAVIREAGPAATQPRTVTVRVERWELGTGKRQPLVSLPADYSGGLAVAPAEGWFAVHDAEQRVALYRLTDGELVRRTPPMGAAIRVLAVSPGGTRLAVGLNGEDSVLVTVRTADGTLGQRVPLAGTPTTLTFLPDGANLLVGCQDGRLLRVHAGR